MARVTKAEMQEQFDAAMQWQEDEAGKQLAKIAELEAEITAFHVRLLDAASAAEKWKEQEEALRGTIADQSEEISGYEERVLQYVELVRGLYWFNMEH